MKSNSTIHSVVFVALFAALTYIATAFIHIPTPGAFVHMGNAVLLLAVLLLGYFRGALAGGLGFFFYDMLNGYTTEAPYFILESFIVGAAAYGVFKLFQKKPTKIWQIVVIAAATGVAKIIMTQIKNTVMNLVMGASFNAAFVGALAKLPATLINVAMTIIVVSIIYFPLKKAMKSLTHSFA